MALKHSNRVSLSKSILEMKFMKRTKEKVDKQEYQKEGEEYFGNSLPKRSGRFITEASYIVCEDLIEGRLSFRGENPEIERIMELEQMEKPSKPEIENETDVSDAQMAAMWKSTTKINVKNFNMKINKSDPDLDVEPKRKKPKFLKPED